MFSCFLFVGNRSIKRKNARHCRSRVLTGLLQAFGEVVYPPVLGDFQMCRCLETEKSRLCECSVICYSLGPYHDRPLLLAFLAEFIFFSSALIDLFHSVISGNRWKSDYREIHEAMIDHHRLHRTTRQIIFIYTSYKSTTRPI